MSDSPDDPYNPLAIQSIADSLARELLDQPCGPLPPAQRFNGAGVYALYYRGPFAEYAPLASRNQDSCEAPIYIGKAVPKGGRKGVNVETGSRSTALLSRLSQHAVSIDAATNLDLSDFRCRYRVIEELFIDLAERTLIQRYKPLWNAVLDGFGNKDPGEKRYTGKRPAWDEVHPGRKWSPNLPSGDKTQEQWLAEIRVYLSSWERGTVGEITLVDNGSGEVEDE